jgi:hypothetical protein
MACAAVFFVTMGNKSKTNDMEDHTMDDIEIELTATKGLMDEDDEDEEEATIDLVDISLEGSLEGQGISVNPKDF